MSNLLLSVYVCLRALLKERRDLALESPLLSEADHRDESGLKWADE